MIRHPIRLTGILQRQLAASFIMDAAPDGCVVSFKQGDIRSPAQNDAMWAKLDEVAQQVVWYGAKLTAEDWKDVLTASLRKTRVVPTIDGDGFVPLGMRTSQMTKTEMGALLELIDMFAAQQGVVFTAPREMAEARR